MIRTTFALVALVATVALGACTAADDAPDLTMNTRTVLVTRHAEKDALSADPSLSPIGKQRAQALARLDDAQSVTTIITTQYKRTIETAQPLAEELGIKPRVVNASANPKDLQDLASDILTSAEKGTVLVVGHSNTVPMIIRALGGPDGLFLAEDSYGDLFILSIDEAGGVFVHRTRYGD
ncbi:MAG: phosphoglycerate mutase family protein [Phycisphaerales bacterium JB065]